MRRVLGCSCGFLRGRCSEAVHLSQSSMAAPSSFFSLARAMQSSQGTFGAGRRPRGRPVFEPDAFSLMASNSRSRAVRIGKVKVESVERMIDCRGGLVETPSWAPAPRSYIGTASTMIGGLFSVCSTVARVPILSQLGGTCVDLAVYFLRRSYLSKKQPTNSR